MLAKKKKVRTKKHSEMKISPLNSTVQNNAADFDEPIVGDCQHCSPYHTIMMSKTVYTLVLVMTMYHYSPMNEK